jgi:hypothetical protein
MAISKSTDSSSVCYLLNVRALTPLVCPSSCFLSIPVYHYGSFYHLLRKGKSKIHILDCCSFISLFLFFGSHECTRMQASLRLFTNSVVFILSSSFFVLLLYYIVLCIVEGRSVVYRTYLGLTLMFSSFSVSQDTSLCPLCKGTDTLRYL